MQSLPRNHVGGAVVALANPALWGAGEDTLGTLAFDLTVQRQVYSESCGEGVEVLVGDEADDYVRSLMLLARLMMILQVM